MFCKIAKGVIAANILYRDGEIVAFEDIKPEAPVHIVLIPLRHIEKVSDLEEKDIGIVGRLVFLASRLARKKGIGSSGYRLVFNCNRDAGQEVPHLHLHLLGGRKFLWPPG